MHHDAWLPPSPACPLGESTSSGDAFDCSSAQQFVIAWLGVGVGFGLGLGLGLGLG